MPERHRVNLAVQVILCVIPIVWLFGFYRIEKLASGILMVIGVTIVALFFQFVIPWPIGSALAWLVSFLVPLYYMVKWSQEWNENFPIDSD